MTTRRSLLTGGAMGGLGGMAALVSAKAQGAAVGLQGGGNVCDPGAKGDGQTDDTDALQTALSAGAAMHHGVLYLPPALVGKWYVVRKPLVVHGPVSIMGPGPLAVTLMATGFKPGQFLLDLDCDYRDTILQVLLTGLTLRSDNSAANGVRIRNVAYVLVKQVVSYQMRDAVIIEGRGTYSLSLEQFTAYDTARHSVLFNGATGGQYSFVASTFSGQNGVFVDGSSEVDGLSFLNCNFEQCAVNSFRASGNVLGLNFNGCRTEGCNGDDFQISPVTGKLVAGL